MWGFRRKNAAQYCKSNSYKQEKVAARYISVEALLKFYIGMDYVKI
jgi:hypothetical protein